MEDTINTLPFVVEAIAQKKLMRKDIDSIYQRNKYEFYELAKNSEWYDHPAITEGDIFLQEYGRKVLGILLYSQNDPELAKEIMGLLRDNFRTIYDFVDNVEIISIDEFTAKHLNSLEKLDSLTDGEVLSIYSMMLFFSLNLGKEMAEETEKLIQDVLIARMGHYNPQSPYKISYERLDEKLLKKSRSIQQRIYDHHYEMRKFRDILHAGEQEGYLSNWVNAFGFIFDFEELSPSTLFDNIEFTQQDIEEILVTYFLTHRDQNIECASRYLISAMYIKYLLKAYKQIKNHYFKNNRETMFIELKNVETAYEDTKKQLEELKETKKKQQRKINELSERVNEEYKRAEGKFRVEIDALQRENKSLRKELEEWELHKRELNALREVIFSLEHEYESIEDVVPTNDINTSKIIVIGGHPSWQEQIKEFLPNVRLVDMDALNFDFNKLIDVNLIVFNTALLRHAMYYKAIAYARKNDIRVSYITNQNIDMSLRQISEAYKK